MTEEIYRCHGCGAEENSIEKFSDTNWICKRCGLGTKGKPTGTLLEHLKELEKAVRLAIIMFPNLTRKQLTFRVGFHLHRTQEHPERRDGYCEVCNISYSKLSAEEFREKTGGYTKEKWLNEST
jgi:DNA-directed RNA polymerase subunit RPC12/RpoP